MSEGEKHFSKTFKQAGATTRLSDLTSVGGTDSLPVACLLRYECTENVTVMCVRQCVSVYLRVCSCLCLQSVPANLHATRLHIKQQ